MTAVLPSIRNHLSSLRKSEQKVAACVLEDPEAVISLTITDFAELSRTSEPTVIRFCRKLGLSGFLEFKLALARDLPSTQSLIENVSDGDTLPVIFNKMFQSAKDAIDTTMNRLDMELLQQAVDVLAEATRIEFYGFGISGIVAQDAQNKFFRLGIPCIACSDSHTQVMSAALLGAGDVVVAISHTGSSLDLLESVTVAREAGATVIGIVGHEKTPLTKICDISLSAYSREVALKLAPTSSRLAQLAIIDVLMVAVAYRDAERMKDRIERAKIALKNKKH